MMEVASLPKLDFLNEEQRIKKVSTILLKSLVQEPRKRPVPNHLLESKVYSQHLKNNVIEANPGTLHFGGYEIGKRHRQTLKLVNISPDVINLHIIPPQTKYFTIVYNKIHRLVPGLAFIVRVEFVPDEWRYYSDCVRLHCQGEETLLVPLHAYPAMNQLDFPSHINLSDVPLGQSKQHIIPVHCSCPIDFEFGILCTQPHQSFQISPTSGVIPANGLVKVTVTFTPCDYGTAQMRIELLISEFNAKPYSCVLTGTCSPHLAVSKENLLRALTPPKVRQEEVDKPVFLMSRKKRHLQTMQHNASKIIEYQNFQIPSNLWNPHAVVTVLNQQPGKLKAKDLRAGISYLNKDGKTRQMKETLFEQKVQQNVEEEEANHLRWQVHLGSDPITEELRKKLNCDRRAAEDEYRTHAGSPDLNLEYKRAALTLESKRVLRSVDQCPTLQPRFDPYVNHLWGNRHRALRGFQQVARKVLVRCRMNRRLVSLQKLSQSLKSEEDGMSRSEGRAVWSSEESDGEIPRLSAEQVTRWEFPAHSAELSGDETILRGFLAICPKPAEVKVKQSLPFYNLKVPQYYKLMGYQPVGVHEAFSSYKPRGPVRPLQSGAEDELLVAVTAPESPESPGPPRVTSVTRSLQSGSLSLTPPEQLLRPPEYHPLHVFNPAPGLMAFKGHMSYSETDLDCHLCPLPKYLNQSDSAVPQRRFLNRGDIIPGLVTWRKFPAVSLSLASAIASSRRSHWCDPFNVDLLPEEGPATLRGLEAKDKENIATREEEEEEDVLLTPVMLKAEFTLIQTAPEIPQMDTKQQPPELSSQGQRITELSSQGQRITELFSQGQRITELSSQGQRITELSSQGQRITELSSQGQRITELSSQGQGITELSSQGQRITELSSQGQGITELSSQGQGITELSSQGQGITELSSQGQGIRTRLAQMKLLSIDKNLILH